ncbi:MAG TPA: EamA family transporter [Steroidobacteraceae bacterium]|nr:EamA family transporter [Steroidobacteraceae bacterium]
MKPSPLVIFLIISLIWGLTWIAIKIGVEATPPFFFAAVRFIAAGGLLLALLGTRVDWAGLRREWRAVLAVSMLMATFSYGPTFWGMQGTASGLAAVVNMSMTPLTLFIIGVALGAERFERRKLAGVLIGIAGLVLLFWPELQSGTHTEALSLAALLTGTLVYCLGSVLSGRWLTGLHTASLSGAVMLIGGVGLAVLSALFERVTADTLRALLEPAPLLSLAFLTLGGSIVAFTLFLYLLRVWGPTRAGLFAFVSPVVALVTGALALGERIDPLQGLGAAVLIGAAAFTVGRDALSARGASRAKLAE